jgi:hypothetical protein
MVVVWLNIIEHAILGKKGYLDVKMGMRGQKSRICDER